MPQYPIIFMDELEKPRPKIPARRKKKKFNIFKLFKKYGTNNKQRFESVDETVSKN